MSQITALIDIIKKQLKAQGKTYADIAQRLDLSEASVKRLFADKQFSLQRLETILESLGFELSEIMQLVVEQQQQLSQLTIEQEQEIANDVGLLLVTVSVMNHFRFDELISEYKLSETECIQKLAKLDRLKIIELLPNNRIKLLIAPNFSWLPKGPIQQFFQQKIQQDFFKSNFDKECEKLMVLNGVMSVESVKKIQNKMQRLADEFTQLITQDKSSPVKNKIGLSMVLAKRRWRYSIFDQYRK